MPQKTQNSAVWPAVVLVALLLGLTSGCQQSGIQPQLLPGVWKMSVEQLDVIWTFAPDGAFRWQLRAQNVWFRLTGADLDVAGRWQLSGDQLTIELTETPPLIALSGTNWTGQNQTLQIRRLTDSTLEFADADFAFQRSLVPPGK